MRSWRALLLRLGHAIGIQSGDPDANAELESHLQFHIDDNIRAGLSPQEARRQALLKLGGVAQTRERMHERRGLPIVDSISQDITYTWRTLKKSPAFTATAVLTLALGIGATSAIFSLVNAVLLRPLPFADSSRLVKVWAVDLRRHDDHDSMSYGVFVDWRDQSRSFSAMTAYANRSVTISGDGASELVPIKRVTPSFFDVLGVAPAVGRTFRPNEDDPGSHVVVLSDGFWKRHYGSGPDAIGRTLVAEGVPLTIIGVMPPGFHVDAYKPEQLYLTQPIDANRGHGFLHTIGRLKPGVTNHQAQADLSAISARLRATYPRTDKSLDVTVEPLVDALAGPSRLALLILLGAVSMVLLIACTNVACLLLARGAARTRELAVRAALGAGRARLTRQLLIESVALAGAGGLVGLVAADWMARGLASIVGEAAVVPRIDSARTDVWVLGFTIVISMATGILFGVVPALSSSRPDLTDALRDAGRTSTGSRAPRLRRTLVVAETALALVLLTGAGVLMKTLLTLRSTQPGFDARNMLAAELWLQPARFSKIQDRVPFFQGTLERVRALPGVRAAMFVADLPLNDGQDTQSFHIVGRPDPSADRLWNAGFNIVSAGYFRGFGTPIRDGRDFLDSDGPMAPGAIVINETAAKRFWPGESPIGRQINLPITRTRSQLLTVVGVAGDVRHVNLAEAPRPEIFVNSMQTELAWPWLVLAVRTTSNPLGISDAVKRIVREVDPNVPIQRVTTVEDVVARSIAAPQLFSILLGAFALAAVTLAAVGVYGLVSYSVTQRSHEMGIRLALGASRRDIVRLVLGQGVRLAIVGAVIGVAGGMAAARALVGLIKGVEANDPVTFATVTLVLLAVAVLASYLPARRAAKLDPLSTLRFE